MKPLRVIQVGIGGMGDRWLRVVKDSEEVEHAAVVDINPEILEKQCAAYGLDRRRAYLSLAEALRDVQADAVIDVTPPRFHEEIATAAFEAGLHVLSEKPLADTFEAAQRIVSKADKAGVVYMVAQNYRYSQVMQTMKQILDSKRYGKPGQVHIAFFKGPHFGGFREEMPYPLIVDMSIHHFDLIRYLLSADPKRVMGWSWNPQWSWYRGDASAAVMFEMTDGIYVSYAASWCATGDETPWNGNWHVECERGVVILRDDQVWAGFTGEPLQAVPLLELPLVAQPYLLHEFYQAVTTGSTPATNGRDNLKSLAMVFNTVRSFETGAEVSFT